MSIMIAAALAATQAVAPAAVPPAAMDHSRTDHAHHQQHGTAPDKDGCACCKDMAQGSGPMPCCDKHGEGGDHADHGAKH